MSVVAPEHHLIAIVDQWPDETLQVLDVHGFPAAGRDIRCRHAFPQLEWLVATKMDAAGANCTAQLPSQSNTELGIRTVIPAGGLAQLPSQSNTELGILRCRGKASWRHSAQTE